MPATNMPLKPRWNHRRARPTDLSSQPSSPRSRRRNDSPRGARAASKQDESCFSWASAEIFCDSRPLPSRGLQLTRRHQQALEVEEARQAGGPVVVVDVEVGPDRAVRVAGGALRGLAAQAGDAARQHRQGVQRDPVVRHPRQPGLTAELQGQVAQVERRLGRPRDLHAAGRGHRLHADAGDVVAVLQGEPEDRPELVDVEAGHDRGDQHGAHVRAHEVLEHAQLLVQERLAAQRQVHARRSSRRTAGRGCAAPRPRSGGRSPWWANTAAVRGHLDVIEAHLAGHAQDLEELRVQRRLAPRELDVAAGLGCALHQGPQHAAERSPGPGSSRCRSATSAKQTGQRRLQRLVRSMTASSGRLVVVLVHVRERRRRRRRPGGSTPRACGGGGCRRGSGARSGVGPCTGCAGRSCRRAPRRGPRPAPRTRGSAIRPGRGSARADCRPAGASLERGRRALRVRPSPRVRLQRHPCAIIIYRALDMCQRVAQSDACPSASDRTPGTRRRAARA